MLVGRILKFSIFFSTLYPVSCDNSRSGSRFIDELLKNGKKSTEGFEPVFKKVGDVVPEDALRRLSVLANDALEKGIPAQLGYGFVVGYSSGYCVKKVSKLVAFVMGGFFMGLQLLASNGYANVNQDKLKVDMEGVMDLNKDGKVDAEDAKVAYEKLHHALSNNVPAGGGFTAGLLMGLRS